VKAITEIGDPRLVKALAHPIRVRILTTLEHRMASPSELAEELGLPLPNVSYHVRKLVNLGLLKLAKTTPRRGAIEHYYKAKGRIHVTDRAWAEVPEVVKEAMIGTTLHGAVDFIEAGARIGGFNRTDSHISRQPLRLDKQGFAELAELVNHVHHEAQRIQGDSEQRLSKADHTGEISSGLVLMLFEAPPIHPSDDLDKPTPGAQPAARAPRRSKVTAT
jgi:DNA-binding transcriptional ArsR family regulator